jgi:hypothetical protein
MAKKVSEQDELYVRRLQLWQKLVGAGDVVRGSVVVLRRPCTRRNCRRCASGERHAATYLGHRQGGKLHWVYLPADLVPRVRAWVKNYRDLEAVLQELSRTNVAILRAWARERSRKRPESPGPGGSKR